MISPAIWEDPAFNKLSLGGRLLFIGMFSNADDDGYIRGDRGSLKRLVFGFDEIVSLDDWIDEVSRMKNIHFYEVEGEKFAHFLRWKRYQKQREERIQESIFPLCVICQTDVRQMSAEVVESSVVESSVRREEEVEEVVEVVDEPSSLLGKIKFLRKWAETKMSRKFPKPIKQEDAIRDMLNAGFSIQEIKNKWEAMEGEDFWQDKSFNFVNVANSIAGQNSIKKFNKRFNA